MCAGAHESLPTPLFFLFLYFLLFSPTNTFSFSSFSSWSAFYCSFPFSSLALFPLSPFLLHFLPLRTCLLSFLPPDSPQALSPHPALTSFPSPLSHYVPYSPLFQDSPFDSPPLLPHLPLRLPPLAPPQHLFLMCDGWEGNWGGGVGEYVSVMSFFVRLCLECLVFVCVYVNFPVCVSRFMSPCKCSPVLLCPLYMFTPKSAA